MKKEKIKQIVLIGMAIVLMGVGYLNFNYETNDSVEVAATDEQNDIHLGDVQLVNSEAISDTNYAKTEYTEALVSNDELFEETNSSSTEQKDGSTNTDEYFAETRLERDKMYSEMIETYQKILSNNDISQDQKMIASQEITNITNIKNGTMIAENLVKNKGFQDVVILVNNGVASVIVKTENLTQDQIVKIQNIVSRELGMEIQNINISNK